MFNKKGPNYVISSILQNGTLDFPAFKIDSSNKGFNSVFVYKEDEDVVASNENLKTEANDQKGFFL